VNLEAGRNEIQEMKYYQPRRKETWEGRGLIKGSKTPTAEKRGVASRQGKEDRRDGEGFRIVRKSRTRNKTEENKGAKKLLKKRRSKKKKEGDSISKTEEEMTHGDEKKEGK